MSDAPTPPPPPPPPGSNPQEQPEQVHRFAHNPTSARVPERVARGATATGFLAFFGPNEFVIDFLQFITRPAHLIARVVMTPVVAEQFLAVLRQSLGQYQNQHGNPAPLPKPPGERPRAPQEIY